MFIENIKVLRRVLSPFPQGIRERLEDVFWTSFWKNELRSSNLGPEDMSLDIRGSERTTFLEAVCSFTSSTSFLELGCGFGQNFYSLLRLFPQATFEGVDLDPRRIEMCHSMLSQQFPHRELRFNTLDVVDGLSRYPDKSYDLVLSSAFLLYVGGSHIEKVAEEMLRISRLGVVLLEQQQENPFANDQHRGIMVPPGRGRPGYWHRDYQKLFSRLPRAGKIEVRGIPNPRWDIEEWKRLGRVFIIERAEGVI